MESIRKHIALGQYGYRTMQKLERLGMQALRTVVKLMHASTPFFAMHPGNMLLQLGSVLATMRLKTHSQQRQTKLKN